MSSVFGVDYVTKKQRTGNLIPVTGGKYDLGSGERPYKTLYVQHLDEISIDFDDLEDMPTNTLLGNVSGVSSSPSPISSAQLKTLLNITNVENTALSTWPGSANIVNLGTISTGTIPLANIATIPTNTLLGNNTVGSSIPIALTTGQTKTLLSLNNVENTALSTWAGTTNIVNLGTISAGTIPLANIAQFANNTLLGNVSGVSGIPTALNPTQIRTLLSISNVENTALSTWAGTANITNLGTISVGTIPLANIAQFANNTLLGNVSGVSGIPTALNPTQIRTLLSISNVENTALSTWAGTANITNLGTISVGTIPLANIATIATNTLLGNNTVGSSVPIAMSISQTRTLLSLNNVENTALSTWAGTTNITTLGTISSGTIPLANIATIATNTLLGNNTGGSSVPIALTTGQTKTLLSLNNVENTALSTWAGTANITTLGTVSSGIWNASTLIGTYGGTGVNNGNRTFTLSTASAVFGGAVNLAGNVTTSASAVNIGGQFITGTSSIAIAGPLSTSTSPVSILGPFSSTSAAVSLGGIFTSGSSTVQFIGGFVSSGTTNLGGNVTSSSGAVNFGSAFATGSSNALTLNPTGGGSTTLSLPNTSGNVVTSASTMTTANQVVVTTGTGAQVVPSSALTMDATNVRLGIGPVSTYQSTTGATLTISSASTVPVTTIGTSLPSTTLGNVTTTSSPYNNLVTEDPNDTMTYNVTATSETSTSTNAYRAFIQGNNGQGWTSAATQYNSTTGAYTGANTLTVSGNATTGERIALQVSAAQSISGYRIGSRSTFALSAPCQFTLAGSNNGSTWTLIDTQTNPTPFSDATTISYYYQLSSPSPTYTYFTLVCQSVFASSGRTAVQFAILQLFRATSIVPVVQIVGTGGLMMGDPTASSSYALIPPVGFSGGNTSTDYPNPASLLSSTPVGDGVFEIWASSQYSVDNSYLQAQAVDGSTGFHWRSSSTGTNMPYTVAGSIGSANTGGAAALTTGLVGLTGGATTYLGQFFQIKCPFPFVAKQFLFWKYTTGGPRDFVILGSNNGNTTSRTTSGSTVWNVLYQETGRAEASYRDYGDGPTIFDLSSNTTPYTYFRFVANKLNGTNTILGVSELCYMGYYSQSIVPHPSQQISMRSSTQGLGVPCMSSLNRIRMATPAIGTMVYDTTNGQMFVYNASGWAALN